MIWHKKTWLIGVCVTLCLLCKSKMFLTSLCLTVALHCHTGQNKGRYCKQERSILLVLVDMTTWNTKTGITLTCTGKHHVAMLVNNNRNKATENPPSCHSIANRDETKHMFYPLTLLLLILYPYFWWRCQDQLRDSDWSRELSVIHKKIAFIRNCQMFIDE